MAHVRIVPTRGGWCRVALDALAVMVRWEDDGDGMLRLDEVIAAPGPAVAAIVDLPVGWLTTWANASGAGTLREALAWRSETPVAAVATVDAWERGGALRRILWGLGAAAEAEQEATMALQVPAVAGRKPPGFYETVAEAYAAAAAESGQPVAAVAAANGIPISRVREWVKEARRRGVLTSARGPQ